MKFSKYKNRRDAEMFFESTGFGKSEVQQTSKAMQRWVDATQDLLEAIQRIPETSGSLSGGSDHPTPDNPLLHEMGLEVQRVRHVLEEANLDDLVDRMNQYTARLATACERLTD